MVAQILIRIVALIAGLCIGLWAGPWVLVVFVGILMFVFARPWEYVALGVFSDFLFFSSERSIIFGFRFTLIFLVLFLISYVVGQRIRV
jgi:predicted membrane protein